jgi:nucleoside-diphosphate-sugar epimerase
MGNLILGYGLLGKELVKQTGWDYKCRKDGFDLLHSNLENEIVDYIDLPHEGRVGYATPPVIINCIANTDTYSDDKKSHWDINYAAVSDLVEFCNKFKIKLVHISTDYIYSNSNNNVSEEDIPIHGNNWYSYTKLLADGYVQLKSNDYLIIRCTHKPKPFPYENAWIDMFGNFDYVDKIAGNIIKLIDKKCSGVYNVGTGLKSIYNMALETKKDVKPILKPNNIPGNTTMDITKLRKEI